MTADRHNWERSERQQIAYRNHRWSALLAETLWQNGILDLVIAPGSRSAPLALACGAHPQLQLHTHFDERGAGFFALGLAKARQQPVAILVTSGSAVANLLPAVVEAAQTRGPLLLLTADRPAELIGCGANQAINQRGLFSHFVAQALYLPAADELTEQRQSRQQKSITVALKQVRTAIATAAQQGPVQINCPFREPLYLDPDAAPYRLSDDPLAQGYLADLSSPPSPTTRGATSDCATANAELAEPEADWHRLSQQEGIIIAGAMSAADADAVIALADRLCWPLLGDLQSQTRHASNTLGHFDLWLNSEEARAQFASATLILQFGGRLLSKRLQQAVAELPLQHYWLIAPDGDRLDPYGKTNRQINATIPRWIKHHLQALDDPRAMPRRGTAGSRLKESFQRWERMAQQLINATLPPDPSLPVSELAVVQLLTAELDDQAQLMTGNSLPVRLLELLAASLPCPLFANRGASGIDGLLATACGIAAADPVRPCVLLIGDMSLLHDLNSLTLLARHQGPLVVIVLNNGGGNIFHALPVPQAALGSLFQQPTRWHLPAVCQGFALNCLRPATLGEFRQQLVQALSAHCATVIEVLAPTGESVNQLKQLNARFRNHQHEQ